MSNHTSKRAPENLADFAQLANISAESLEHILERLQQAGIPISDPHETLSNQMKAKLLAFFRSGSGAKDTKQTRVTQLHSGVGTAKSVKITTVTRKVSTEPEYTSNDNTAPTQSNTPHPQTTELDNPTPSEQPKLDSPVFSESHGTTENKQKVTTYKKTSKLQASSPLKKRYKDPLEILDEPETVRDQDKEIEHRIHSPNEKPGLSRPTDSLTTVKTSNKHIKQVISIPERITISELAKKMSMKDVDVMAHLEKIGVAFDHIHEQLHQETAVLLAEDMGYSTRLLFDNANEIALKENLEQLMGAPSKRSPIVTIMGHVDHGKTSLLDYIRRTKVTAQEKGGITQHIGAYQVASPKGIITFLDTPGHAAFTAMRARGAHLTDIVALVVAADDGVMPQTIEAIQHAKAANVPIVVAINKMDKPGATIENAQQGLAKYDLIPEEWGGETLFVPLSAKTGEGVSNLLDALLLQAEIGELQAPVKGPAQGIIIESRLEKGQGPVSTMIIQKGTLKKGDILLAGTSFGRIKALYNAEGKPIASAGPSTPVELVGLSQPPVAGESGVVVPNERKAREIAQDREIATREGQLKANAPRSLEALLDPLHYQLKKSIPIIIKADVQGSAEALNESLVKLSTETISIKPLMVGVGAITESDINLAIASKASIFGFNVRIDNKIKRLIQQEQVVIYHHTIIYELLKDAQKMISNRLGTQTKETVLGKASVRQIFRASKTAAVVGCIITEGSIDLHHKVRIVRDEAVIHQGKLSSLRRFKDDVKVVNTGTECGISIKNYNDLQIGDTIESYESIKVSQDV